MLLTGKLVLLGSTGSIGKQTLDCCKRLGYEICALAANRSVDLLEQQARAFTPRYIVVSDKNAYQDLKVRLADTPVRLLEGMDGLCEAASLPEAGLVCNALVGMTGLRPTLAALDAGNPVALANKETLVAGGALVMELSARKKAPILPVDSEHSAIFQSLQGGRRGEVRKILLTASGGPFRGRRKEELAHVSAAEALCHPNWSMGKKVTIDSATMMNKGLELIEAMWLFDLSPEQIEVVVHPQSILHSAVEFCDGALIGQMGVPDMHLPIQYALTYPERMPLPGKPLSLTECGSLTFEKPDLKTFACLAHCIEAAKRGGLFPCAANSANEEAVALFLDGKISFGKIAQSVGMVLEHVNFGNAGNYTLEQVLETDREARALVREYCHV